MPLNARKDVQPLQSNMVLPGKQMRRKRTGDMTDASPVGVTTAATADRKVTAHQQKLSSPILSAGQSMMLTTSSCGFNPLYGLFH